MGLTQSWMTNDHPSRPPTKVKQVAGGIEERLQTTKQEGSDRPASPTPPIKKHNLDIRGLERRLSLLLYLHEYHLLDTWQLQILDGGSPEWLSRILKTLTHEQYIIRPAGTRPHYRDGNNHTLYALGNKGADVLEFELGIPRRKPSGEKINFSRRYKEVTNHHFKHSVLVNDLRVVLENNRKQNSDVVYIKERDFLKSQPRPKKTWYVPVSIKDEVQDLGITPDDIFQLEDMIFFYEADCGTESINANARQPVSIFKKMLAYFYTDQLKIHTELWNIPHFRVPIVTTSAKRIAHMIEANKVFNNGEGSELFLFTTKEELRREPDLAKQFWINGKGEEGNIFANY